MKKLIIIICILSSLFIFGCNKISQTTQTVNTGEGTGQNIENITGNIVDLTGTEQNNLTGATSGDIKVLIDEYKAKETGDSNKLNENDIDLMEKVIEKIEKK